MTATTEQLLADLEKALAASNTPEQRAKRERLASITREAESLSAEITAADAAITAAERALGEHLAKKHADVPKPAPPVAAEPDIPGWPNADPDLLDGSVMETGGKRYVVSNGQWVET